jgi:hypothetical protein
LKGDGPGAFLELPLSIHSNFVFSVHRLKPADIKVIGAMGDSLTVSYSNCRKKA